MVFWNKGSSKKTRLTNFRSLPPTIVSIVSSSCSARNSQLPSRRLIR
jgi:hypothetical protein